MVFNIPGSQYLLCKLSICKSFLFLLKNLDLVLLTAVKNTKKGEKVSKFEFVWMPKAKNAL